MHFFCRLNAPRPTFTQDMTTTERELMQAHAAYWREWMGKGHVVVFGLVADPGGPFGVGIVEFSRGDEARAFADGDPTIRAAAGFRMDVYPMPMGAIVRE
jgi:YCII-related domain-containing protein